MNRWLILAGYALLVASTQLLWISYAPITTESAVALHTSVANIGYLSAVFQLIYILIALPTGRWLDRNFTYALGAGALATGIGGLLRGLFLDSFGWQFAMQLLIAVGQPLALNALTQVAALYFPKEERPAAISVGSAAIFLGILAAMLAGPPLYAAGGLGLVLRIEAIPAVVAMLWIFIALRTRPTQEAYLPEGGGLGWLRGDRMMWALGWLLFFGFGLFIALSTWLQAILAFFHISDAQSGDLLALMTLAGIVGSALLPPWVASRNRRRAMIATSLLISGAAFLAIALYHGTLWLGVWLVLTGFFLLANLPVVLDWAGRHAGPGRQGAATGFLMMAGMTGGLVLVLAVQVVVGNPYHSLTILVIGVILAIASLAWLPAREAETKAIRG